MDIHRHHRRPGLVPDPLIVAATRRERVRHIFELAPSKKVRRASFNAVLIRVLFLALLGLSLAACSSAVRWENSKPAAKRSRTAAGEHVVRAGDTLHSIAFRYGIDVRNLVRWNRLDNPDFLLVGQRLRLTGPKTASASSAPRPSPDRQSAGSSKPLPPLPQVAAPEWRWPVAGPLVSGFGQPNQVGQGIAIGGRKGAPVAAAASGRVVYKGSGLIGYGQLVIIKHNATFLSAYGHNDRVLVDEGEEVEAGQRIAQMGQGANGMPQLLFEIRKNGEPVDPLTHLPRQ